jgi:hypothetical protein
MVGDAGAVTLFVVQELDEAVIPWPSHQMTFTRSPDHVS